MPLIDIKCKNCDKVFEIFTSQDEITNPHRCPICNGDTTRKYSSPKIIMGLTLDDHVQQIGNRMAKAQYEGR